MAIAFRADAIANYGSSAGTKTCTKPSGTASGDILVACLLLVSDATITPPSGWTHEVNHENNEPTQEHRIHLFWKEAGGSEPADYTWTWSGTVGCEIWIGSFSGCVNGATPIDASHHINAGTTGTSATAISITTTQANTMLVYYLTSWNGGGFGPPTVPGTFTEPANGDGVIGGYSYYLWSSSGDTGSVVGTASPSGTRSVILVALKPAAAASTSFPFERSRTARMGLAQLTS